MTNILKTKEKGNLIVVSGPSGAGKDSVVGKVLEKNKNTWLSVSCTTRPIRGNEVDGVNYFYLSNEQFEKRIKEDDFLEYAKYNNNYYGTPKSIIQDKINNGIDVILVIEIQGALKIKEILPETIFIFILPPTLKELKRRLIRRKTETKDKIIERFKIAYQEINEVTKYNYVIVNDDLDEAADKMNSILLSEKCRVDRIEDIYLNNIEEEIHELLIDKEFINDDLIK